MRRELLLPKLGLTMAEGTLIEWLVAPGERFRAEQSLFVIESEKAAVEVPAEADGVLVEASAAVGTTLPVGSVIGYWDDGAGASDARRAGLPSVAPAAAPTPRPAAAAPPAAPALEAAARPSPPRPAAPARVPVTPYARRLARERGIDLARVQGSGPRGRIRARDLAATPPATA